MAHAAASEVEFTTIYVTASIPFNAMEVAIEGISRRVAAASTGTKVTLGLVAVVVVIGAIWVAKSGKANKFFDRAKPVVQDLGRTYGPPLLETLERHGNGQMAFSRAVVRGTDAQTLGERIARVLAYSSEPLLAVDIARELKAPGNLKDRIQMVRAELRSCAAFTEVTRGRWVLGKPSGYEAAPLPLEEIIDCRARLHRDTRRPRQSDPEAHAGATA